MAVHFCISNPCWICYPEYAPKEPVPFMFLPKLEDEPGKIWKMRYKDTDSDSAPWNEWASIDKPSDFLIEALRKEGMFRLEVIN